jgi:hypothetical protein
LGFEKDMDDELLKRFLALKAPNSSVTQTTSGTGSTSGDPAQSIDDAAKNAQREDEELAAIAEGRWTGDSYKHHEAEQEVEHESDDLEKRISALRGGSAKTDHEEPEDLGDEEVRSYSQGWLSYNFDVIR